MPWWGWVLIVVGVIIFIPIKIVLTRKFLSKNNKEKDEDMLDE